MCNILGLFLCCVVDATTIFGWLLRSSEIDRADFWGTVNISLSYLEPAEQPGAFQYSERYGSESWEELRQRGLRHRWWWGRLVTSSHRVTKHRVTTTVKQAFFGEIKKMLHRERERKSRTRLSGLLSYKGVSQNGIERKGKRKWTVRSRKRRHSRILPFTKTGALLRTVAFYYSKELPRPQRR